MVVYQFNRFCEDSYVGMTSKTKDHIPKRIDAFYKMIVYKNKSIRVVNASKRSAIEEIS